MSLFGGLFDVDGNGFVTPEEELFALDSIEHIYQQENQDDEETDKEENGDW